MSVNMARIVLCAFLLATLGSTACMNRFITITDAKMATGINEKFMPIKVTNVFPSDSKTVFCWFQWKNGRENVKITARWHFVTDYVHILDYEFVIPRKQGSGGVSLSMPDGKTLPVGSYKVDLLLDARKLKSLTFKVE